MFVSYWSNVLHLHTSNQNDMNKTNFNRRVNTQIRKTGYGHWQVTMPVYGKPFTIVTTNSSAIDDFDDDNDRRIACGYIALRREVMNAYRLSR